MTNKKSYPTICDLSFRAEWTPINRLFFSQCIQDSDEDESLSFQRKKKLKRKSYSSKNRKSNYIVYEFVSSSESDVPASNEFNSADEFEKAVKRKCSGRKRKGIVYQSDSSSKSREQLSEKQQSVHCFKGKENRKSMDHHQDSSLESEEQMDDQQNSVSNSEGKENGKSLDHHQDSSLESEGQMDDRQNSVYNSENNMLPRIADESQKYTPDEDDYKIPSSSETTDTDDGSSDSSSYEVSRKKRMVRKFKKRDKKSSKKAVPELSEYEKNIQKNREEKMVLLEALKIMEIKEDFKEAVEDLKLKTDKKKNNKRSKEVNKKNRPKYLETEKVLRQSARQKSLLNYREETFPSSQSSIVNKELLTFLSFEEAAVFKKHVYHDFISECSEPNFKVSKLLDNGYVSHFEKMVLQESLITNLGYNSINSMAVHESQEKIIICYGHKNGEINFCYLNSDSDICTFRPHLQSVNTLKFHPYFPNMLLSSSADGTLCSGDFEKKLFRQIFKAKSCNHFDVLSPTSYLVAHGKGYVSIVDNRSHRRTFEKRHKCCEDIAKTVSLHPVEKNYFISAHQKGSVRLWDLRKLQNEPIIDVSCNGNVLSSFFSPVTGNSVLVTLSDAICLLDRSSLNEGIKLKKSVVNLWTPCRATWLPNTDDALVFGSKSRIEIFDDKLNNIFNFTDKHFDCYSLINVFHSSLPFLASANRSKVLIFSEIE